MNEDKLICLAVAIYKAIAIIGIIAGICLVIAGSPVFGWIILVNGVLYSAIIIADIINRD